MTGDSVYGADHVLRRLIERHGRGYVLAVTSTRRLGLEPVEDWLEDVPAKAWRRLSAGEGAKTPRLYDWVYLPYRSLAPQGWKNGLLIRRSIKEPGKLAFYLTLSPVATSLAELVRVAGTRWAIEACFEAAKGEVGLDQYEVRSPRASADARTCGGGAGACCPGWAGWHRHVTLAHAYLAVVRQTAIGGIGDRRPRRRAAAPHRAEGASPVVFAGVGTAAESRAAIAWSLWRRGHQQRARRCHWRRRTRRDARF